MSSQPAQVQTVSMYTVLSLSKADLAVCIYPEDPASGKRSRPLHQVHAQYVSTGKWQEE